MACPRKTYAPVFKLQAVKMILEQKLSVAEVAPARRQRESPHLDEGHSQAGFTRSVPRQK
jgi:transposase-like protein